MSTLSHPAPCAQPYVTLLSKSNGRQTVYRPVIIDARGSRPFPAIVRHSAPRNVLSVAMSYANAKGLAFRLETLELATEAASVQAELAEHGIVVEIETPAQPARSDLGPTWSAGYEAGRTEQSRSAPAGLTTAQEREWYDGFDTGAAATRRHGRLKCVVINTSEGQYDLALFPWEDPNQVVAEAEAVIEEQNSKPWLGLELNDEELQLLFERESARTCTSALLNTAGDPAVTRWYAEGLPGCQGFKFDGDFCGVHGRLDQEPGYNEGTQPWLY